MFGIDLSAIQAVIYIEAYQKEAKRFDEFCKTLPIEQANKLIAERDRKIADVLKHQRALEVAREGRSLNFWGNR
jgi:hypothetical protein